MPSKDAEWNEVDAGGDPVGLLCRRCGGLCCLSGLSPEEFAKKCKTDSDYMKMSEAAIGRLASGNPIGTEECTTGVKYGAQVAYAFEALTEKELRKKTGHRNPLKGWKLRSVKVKCPGAPGGC